ncbi:calmodulin-like isoform X2 [Mercenaria mercenaria]|nr:calmodulin-like isoform X2 [Mercenaria mercenaria]
MFDVSNKGKIETSQLGTAVRSLGQNPSEDDIKKMIKEADKKGSGFIEEKDFISTVAKFWKPVNSEDDVIDAFRVFDREGTGYLDAKQLKHVLLNLGEKLDEKEVDELLKEADLDADGQLNYTSLTQLLLESALKR